jgi:CRISPR-associated protein Cmr4
MFKAAKMLFVYVETPLHAGTGRGLGGVDLPIQRERVTGYPIIQASSLKGRLRAEARGRLSEEEFIAIFGPETDRASDHAGALSPGDARILLFPVRSLAGVFAWTTSTDVLARFVRDAEVVGLRPKWNVPEEPAEDQALTSGDDLKAADKVVLEEFTFIPKQDDTVCTIGQWLAENALPEGDEYRYWREALPTRLIILHRNAFRDFAMFSTEIATRVQLESQTKTVAEGPWTEEHLPVDTLLYAPLMASPTRAKNGVRLSGAQVVDKIGSLSLARTVLGGDETIGRGVVSLRFAAGGGS